MPAEESEAVTNHPSFAEITPSYILADFNYEIVLTWISICLFESYIGDFQRRKSWETTYFYMFLQKVIFCWSWAKENLSIRNIWTMICVCQVAAWDEILVDQALTSEILLG